MEKWDLYTKDRTLIGRDHTRGEELPEDGYHLVVHVWIRNAEGRYAISQRAANRPSCPLLWECVGGAVIKGENSLQGAIREVKEEIGIDLSASKGTLLFTETRHEANGKIINDILDAWLFEYAGEITLNEATTDEVAQAKWMSRDEILALYKAHQLVPSLAYFFENPVLSPA